MSAIDCVFWSVSNLRAASWPIHGVRETEWWLYSRNSAKGCIEASARRIRKSPITESIVNRDKLLNAAHRLRLRFMMGCLQSMLTTDFLNRHLNKIARKLFLLNFFHVSSLLKRTLPFLLAYFLDSVVSMSEIPKATLQTTPIALLLYCMTIVTSFFNRSLRNFLHMNF